MLNTVELNTVAPDLCAAGAGRGWQGSLRGGTSPWRRENARTYVPIPDLAVPATFNGGLTPLRRGKIQPKIVNSNERVNRQLRTPASAAADRL